MPIEPILVFAFIVGVVIAGLVSGVLAATIVMPPTCVTLGPPPVPPPLPPPVNALYQRDLFDLERRVSRLEAAIRRFDVAAGIERGSKTMDATRGLG